jgi:hypothetical protein
MGNWGMRGITEGAYARTSDGVVYIFGVGASGYEVVHTERDEERFHSEDQLSPWSPLPGEHVTEAWTEVAGVTGVIIKADEETSLVMWSGLNEPQTWPNKDLEPAWVD